MERSVKKVYAFLGMIAMLIMLIPSMAFAAETGEEKAAICINVPQDWQNPCVWAWDEAGNNAFAAWPGEECEALPDNDGWYYVWVPDWANHIIVNANEGSVQTSELITEGKDAWISVQDADHADISYDAQTKGGIPEYVDKFLIHAKVDASWENPCLWAWSAPDGTNAYATWPGDALEQNGEWLTKEIPGWVNSIIVNGNEGSVQTTDISIETQKDVWVVVNGPEDYTVSYEEPEISQEAETTESINTQEQTTPVSTEAEESVEQSGTPIMQIVIVLIIVAVVVIVVIVMKKKKNLK